jgi:hypothetical protein
VKTFAQGNLCFTVVKASVCVLIGCCSIWCQEPTDAISITGVVSDAIGLSRVEGAIVLVTLADSKHVGSAPKGAKTGTDGSFSIRVQPAARYRVQCEKPGYIFESFVYEAPAGNGFVVDGGRRDPLQIRMRPHAVISGTVTDSTGTPMLGASVRLSRVSFVSGKTSLFTITQTTTNDRGEYRMFGLEAGRYYVSASYQDAGGALGLRLRPERAGSDEVVTEDYATSYFPDALDAASATPVRLRWGTTTKNIDLIIRTAQSFPIGGSVEGLDPDSPPPEIYLQPADPGSLGPSRMYIPDSGSSQFKFNSVPPGSYLLTASTSSGARPLIGRAEFMVSAALNDVRILLQPPFKVAGTVLGPDGNVLSRRPKLVLEGIDSRKSWDISIDSNGQFSVPAIWADRYTLHLSDPTEELFVKSVSINDQEAKNGLVSILASGSRISIVVSALGGSLSGTATSADQRPLERGLAVMISDNSQNPEVRAAVLDPGGTFKFRPLPAGQYKIMCFSDLEALKDASWDVQKKVRLSGERIEIKESESNKIVLVASPMDLP